MMYTWLLIFAVAGADVAPIVRDFPSEAGCREVLAGYVTEFRNQHGIHDRASAACIPVAPDAFTVVSGKGAD